MLVGSSRARVVHHDPFVDFGLKPPNCKPPKDQTLTYQISGLVLKWLNKHTSPEHLMQHRVQSWLQTQRDPQNQGSIVHETATSQFWIWCLSCRGSRVLCREGSSWWRITVCILAIPLFSEPGSLIMRRGIPGCAHLSYLKNNKTVKNIPPTLWAASR